MMCHGHGPDRVLLGPSSNKQLIGLVWTVDLWPHRWDDPGGVHWRSQRAPRHHGYVEEPDGPDAGSGDNSEGPTAHHERLKQKLNLLNSWNNQTSDFWWTVIRLLTLVLLYSHDGLKKTLLSCWISKDAVLLQVQFHCPTRPHSLWIYRTDPAAPQDPFWLWLI